MFSPDPRCRFHQRFCTEPACKRASKAESQQKYRMKLENLWQRQGEKITAKVASRPVDGAKLPELAEGDEKTRQEALNWAFSAVFAGSSSQDVIERMYKNLLAAGREILRKKTEAAARATGRVGGIARRQ